jgi:hypothetical protein
VPPLGSLEEVLEVAILAEDVGKGLLDHIVGASTDEGGVLIDLGCGCVREANRGADLTGLDEAVGAAG